MASTILLMAGPRKFDLGPLQTVAGEFGWTVEMAGDLPQAEAAGIAHRAAAVIFHREAFGPECSWADAVRSVQTALPEVRPVLLHGFSESIDWPELSDAGTFHAIRFPLQEAELRQSLGFVWEAQRRKDAEPMQPSDYARSLQAIARAADFREKSPVAKEVDNEVK